MQAHMEYDTLIQAMVDGSLEPQEQAWLQAHLEECPACRRYLELLQAQREVLLEEPPLPPPALKEGILYKLSLEQEKPKRRFPAFGRWTAIAAVICLVAFGALRLTGGKAGGATDNAAPLALNGVQGSRQYLTGGTAPADTAVQANGGLMTGAAGSPENGAAADERVSAEADGASPQPELRAALTGENSLFPGSTAADKVAPLNDCFLPGYDIAQAALADERCYSVCIFYKTLPEGLDTGSWEPLSAPAGQKQWRVPTETLLALESSELCNEIYYGDLLAEEGLAILITEMEE